MVLMRNIYVLVALFALILQNNATFAQRLVEGTVKSEINKQPIPFATVFVKEDNIETYADIQGKFRIEVSDKAGSIYVISSGFLGQEIEFSKEVRNTTLEVFLKDNDLELKAQVVTANRVEENLQVTPVAGTVIQAINLQNRTAFITTDALTVAPNVITDSWTPGMPIFSIRGFSTNLSDPGIESAVGLYVDDVYYSRGFGFNSLLMDVERMEILRGPQGTLFGKNTVGGLINIITEKPKMTTSASADVNMGTFSSAKNNPLPLFQARAKYNTMILKNRLAFRINAAYSAADGYMKELDTVANAKNKTQFYGARAGLLYTPNPKMSFDLNGFFSKDQGMQYTIMHTSGLGIKTYDTLSNRTSHMNSSGYDFWRNQWGTSLRGQFLVGKNTLNTVTSYYSEKDMYYGDGDVSVLELFESGRTQSLKSFTQEIRYTSPRNQKWAYIYGLHFIAEKIGNHDSLSTFPTFAYAFVGVYDPNYKETYGGGGYINNLNFSGFTSHSLQLTSALKLNAGARLTYENKKLSLYQKPYMYANLPLIYGAALAAPLAKPDSMFNYAQNYPAVTGNLGLDYRINDSIFTYVTASRGFKGGGFNMAYSFAPADSNFSGDMLYYKPEYISNFEWGFKSQFNNRFRFNAAAFYSIYNNKQELLVEGTKLRIANAKRVKGWGVEVEGSAILAKGFQLNVSGAHLNMVYDDFIFGQKTVIVGTDTSIVDNNLKGNKVVKAPDWTASVGLEYSHLFGEKVRILARVDWNYTGYSFNDIKNNASIARMPANMLNARIGFSDKNMRYNIALWGKNLTNAVYAQHGWDFGFEKEVAVNPPRVIGLELRYNFYK